MAGTTRPNDGVLTSLQNCENPIAAWERYIIEDCKEFDIPFDANWERKLT
jgi:hypothetical protein